MTTDREPMEWAHLKKYGYAPGGYMARCHRCQQSAFDLDKRAITCRPCATELYLRENTRQKRQPMTTDRELLEWAAKAAGIELHWFFEPIEDVGHAAGWLASIVRSNQVWNPLVDDGDALRLAVKCRIEIDHSHAQDQHRYVCASRRGCEMMYAPVSAIEEIEDEGQTLAATRRAIVRAAAEIGRTM